MTTVPSLLLYPSDDLPMQDALYPTKEAAELAQQELLTELAAKYPYHFGKRGRPWAVGFRDELLEALAPSGYPEALVKRTLYAFSHSVRYLTNCILSGVGAPRLRLDGTPQGQLQRRELIYALNQLSGLVQRNDPLRTKAYREWAFREMVLGLARGDLTEEALVQAKVRKTVIAKAMTKVSDEGALQQLRLKNQRTGEFHPAVYAKPYLPEMLYGAFAERNPGHATCSKKPAKKRPNGKPKAFGKPKSFQRPGAPKQPDTVAAKAFRERREAKGGGRVAITADKHGQAPAPARSYAQTQAEIRHREPAGRVVAGGHDRPKAVIVVKRKRRIADSV